MSATYFNQGFGCLSNNQGMDRALSIRFREGLTFVCQDVHRVGHIVLVLDRFARVVVGFRLEASD